LFRLAGRIGGKLFHGTFRISFVGNGNLCIPNGKVVFLGNDVYLKNTGICGFLFAGSICFLGHGSYVFFHRMPLNGLIIIKYIKG